LAGPKELAQALFWFPWVGALLGGLYAAAALSLGSLWPLPVAAALVTALTVVLTRGLHLDGLADTLDGLGGGRDPASRLAVMKDSRLGAFGAVGLVVVLLLKYALLLALLEKGRFAGLVLFPAVSRWGLVLLAFLSPYARPEGGLGRAMIEGVTSRTLTGATLAALGLSLVLFRMQGLLVLAAAGLLVLAWSRFFQRTLGGITGDVLGAANELLEVLALGGLTLGQG
jgi:adenosylcobinamide-GDP ribazoletransferase